jgi:hypothetical protein
VNDLVEKNPQNKKIVTGIKEKEKKLKEFTEKVKQATSEEE